MRTIVSVVVVLFLVGCNGPSFLVTPVSSSADIQEIQVKNGKSPFAPKIALIGVEGLLINARTGGFLQPQENKLSLFAQQMDAAENDPAVKAVVLRVNSPGGTVTCSDTMYQTIQRFRQRTHKPVIASGQEVVASGAYYLSTACDSIVVGPTTVVGSVGVIFELFEVDQGLAKLGIASNTIKSAPHKDIGSPFRPMAVDERAILQSTVDEYYQRFIGVVKAKYTFDSPQTLATVTDGRVFSGEEALKLGMVDQVGLLDDAIDLAKQKANAPGASVVMYKRPFGYGGSIYADAEAPLPQANTLQLPLPEAAFLPRGFYYLWQP